jgi:multidrug efflux pump subunit AcrA (membrane-fusion protein)
VLGERADTALLLPLAAVVRAPGGDGGYVVFTVRDDATVAQAKVEVADLLENDVVLSAGPPAGQRVVVEGAAFLRDGERVVVTP